MITAAICSLVIALAIEDKIFLCSGNSLQYYFTLKFRLCINIYSHKTHSGSKGERIVKQKDWNKASMGKLLVLLLQDICVWIENKISTYNKPLSGGCCYFIGVHSLQFMEKWSHGN